MWRSWHQWGSPPGFFRLSGLLLPWVAAPTAVALGIGVIWGLGLAPSDYQQGNSFRIIYVHVPTAALAQFCYLLMAAAAVGFLIWRMKMADVFAATAAPIGAAFTALALATGAIWGKPTWGAWWVWDARTTSMLVQLFLYLGLIALRQALPNPLAAARACAILILVGVVNIPIIKYSVHWWFTLHQGATFTLTSRPAMPASMYLPLICTGIGFYGLFTVALLSAMRTEVLQRESGSAWVADLLKRSV